jgi:hypothetical protein
MARLYNDGVAELDRVSGATSAPVAVHRQLYETLEDRAAGGEPADPQAAALEVAGHRPRVVAGDLGGDLGDLGRRAEIGIREAGRERWSARRARA